MTGDKTESVERHPDVRQEPETLPSRLIARVALATVMIGASLCFATYLFTRARILSVRPSYEFPELTLPTPHEVATVRRELFSVANPRPDVKAQARAELDSFGWVDRARRVVHIPIEDAIELVAREEARGTVGRR